MLFEEVVNSTLLTIALDCLTGKTAKKHHSKKELLDVFSKAGLQVCNFTLLRIDSHLIYFI